MNENTRRHDNLTPSQRKRTMKSVHSKDTKPEMKVRRLIHNMGFRYRLHRSDLPGKPDLVFPSKHKVIFIHGCFWHGHNCKRGQRMPVTNQEYWLAKLNRNKERDKNNQEKLRKLGWDVLILWECQLKDIPELKQSVIDYLSSP
ncbi:MAG: very short patch repair endonuclease [Caldilineaceae bacterium]